MNAGEVFRGLCIGMGVAVLVCIALALLWVELWNWIGHK
jgi:hypothetical protein